MSTDERTTVEPSESESPALLTSLASLLQTELEEPQANSTEMERISGDGGRAPETPPLPTTLPSTGWWRPITPPPLVTERAIDPGSPARSHFPVLLTASPRGRFISADAEQSL